MKEKGGGANSAVSLTLLKDGRPIGDLSVKLLFITCVKVMETIFQRTTRVPLPSLAPHLLTLSPHRVSKEPSPSYVIYWWRIWRRVPGLWSYGCPRGNLGPLSTLSHKEDRRYSRHFQTVTNQLPRKTKPVSQSTLSFLSPPKLLMNK